MTVMEERLQLAEIEATLKQYWEGPQGKNKIRAALFNLVVVVSKEGESTYVHQLVSSILKRFPSRLFQIVEDPKRDYLESRASVETIQTDEGEKLCETIHIEAGGSYRERLPFLLLPHFLPDLPIYLLWGEACDAPLLYALEPLVEKLFFDPLATPSLKRYSSQILSYFEHFHCRIGDLLWLALRGWRHALATHFASQEEVELLASSSLVRIHTQASDTPTRAAYLQAWLATQLNWNFVSMEKGKEEYCLHYRTSQGEVALWLTPTQVKGLAPGEIASVEIEAQGSHFLFARTGDQVRVQESRKELCLLPYALPFPTQLSGQEVLRILFSHERRIQYQNMLKKLSEAGWT